MGAPAAKGPTRRPARERLLDAADELFYSDGVQTVGIDRVIEAAGVAKASLYNSFGSKEALVRAYLERRRASIMTRLRRAVASADGPRERILAVFDAQAEYFAEPGFHGCAFAAAGAEAPAGGAVEAAVDEYRHDVRSLLTDLAAVAGAADPASLGRRLHLVYEAAVTAARLDHDPAIARDARAVVELLLDTLEQTDRSIY